MRGYEQRERARRSARTAAAIGAAALRELARTGYPQMRVAAVAARAGVAPRTVYLHAPTKERLARDALQPRADALSRFIESWRPRGTTGEGIVGELVALHERTYRSEKTLLEILVDAGVPRPVAAILRDLDQQRLEIIARTMSELARRGLLKIRAADATALAHVLLSYPTWRVALTGPARRNAPRLVAAALRAAVLA